METPAAIQTARIEIVKAAYAALNRGDVPEFLRHFHPEIERIEPPGLAGTSVYNGLEAFAAHVAVQRGNWAEGACDPKRFVAAGNRVVAFVRVRVRLKNETEWREGDIADAFAFSDSRIAYFRTFIDVREALEWAGVEATPAG